MFPPTSQLLIAFGSAAAVAGLAWRLRSLSVSGAVAAVFVGFALFGFAGWRGAAALLLFFVSSSLLSKIGKRRKEALAFEKGGERDAMQVLANGGFAAACAFFATPNANPNEVGWTFPMMLLLGALATANADTWATEIGTMFKHPPRRITNLFQKTETGESGAVSLPGTLAAFVGGCLIAAVTLTTPFGETPMRVGAAIAVALGGFFGSLVDSFLGATIQAMYRSRTTGKLTERAREDGVDNELTRGHRRMTNDAVNFLATVAGALIALQMFPVAFLFARDVLNVSP